MCAADRKREMMLLMLAGHHPDKTLYTDHHLSMRIHENLLMLLPHFAKRSCAISESM
jgi:hypothetical protein